MKTKIEHRDGFAYIAPLRTAVHTECLEAVLLRAWLNGLGRDALIQAAILVLSLAAIWMIGLPAGDPLQRWGFVAGLASQPFWIFATWRARQWGMLLLSLSYLGAWLAGIHNNF